MIKLKNKADFILTLWQAGALTAANDVSAEIVPDDGYLDAVLASVGYIGIAGGANDVLVDINKNNVSLISSTPITFSHTTAAAAPSSYGDFATMAPIAVSKGDVLSLDVDQTFNGGTPPNNLVVAFRFRRKTSPAAIVLTGTLV